MSGEICADQFGYHQSRWQVQSDEVYQRIQFSELYLKGRLHGQKESIGRSSRILARICRDFCHPPSAQEVLELSFPAPVRSQIPHRRYAAFSWGELKASRGEKHIDPSIYVLGRILRFTALPTHWYLPFLFTTTHCVLRVLLRGGVPEKRCGWVSHARFDTTREG